MTQLAEDDFLYEFKPAVWKRKAMEKCVDLVRFVNDKIVLPEMKQIKFKRNRTCEFLKADKSSLPRSARRIREYDIPDDLEDEEREELLDKFNEANLLVKKMVSRAFEKKQKRTHGLTEAQYADTIWRSICKEASNSYAINSAVEKKRKYIKRHDALLIRKSNVTKLLRLLSKEQVDLILRYAEPIDLPDLTRKPQI